MAVGRLIADAVADVDAHGLGGAHEAGGLDDAILGNTRDRRCPRGWELLHVLSQLVEAEAPVLDEVVVVEILADDNVQNGQCERAVSAGDDGQPEVGMGAQAFLHGADVDDLHAVFLGIQTAVRIALVDGGVFGVEAPYDQKLALVQL